MFSYEEYVEIINIIKKSNKQKSYREVLEKNSEEFIIVRHDVEFSVWRAYQLACLENKQGIQTAYFFQVSNNSYNILSKKNREMLEEIHFMGHQVGLHFHLNGLTDINKIKKEIQNEILIMNSKLSFDVDSFSIHRPIEKILACNIKIPGLINTYQNDFFSYVKDINVHKPDIKYISDARHQWNYGIMPTENVLLKYKKIQMLIHPYSWNKKSCNNLENFQNLFSEKKQELLKTFDMECSHFRNIKEKIR